MIGFGMTSETASYAATHVHVVALYDAASGRILHLHTVTTVGKATPLTQEHAVAEAKAHAVRRKLDLEGLAVAVSNEAQHGMRPHRIDPETRRFVLLANPVDPDVTSG